MIDAILDTGPLAGALDRDDQWHAWAAKEFASIRQPALTCEAVISEACFVLRGVLDARQKIFALVERGILHIVPVLPDESSAVRALLARYGERMDYADACLVRLSELHRSHTIVTTDTEDFRIYRRFGKQVLPLRVP
ncbi:MAG: PIN domain-containing protein [Verrucomicrobiota bacterium]|nr:PIN domain-containing protein [Verrucomicrobiota bacterium]